jgi:hypothetical protein
LTAAVDICLHGYGVMAFLVTLRVPVVCKDPRSGPDSTD